MCSTRCLNRETVAALVADAGDPGTVIVALADLLDTVRGVLVERLGAFDRSQGYAADGALSCATWLTARTDLATTDARTLVRLAGRLHDHMPATAAAVAAGTISVAKAEHLARCTTGRTLDAFTDHETELLAAVTPLSVDDTRVAVNRWISLADTDGPDPDDPTANRLRLDPSLGRVDVTGSLDPVAGRMISGVLDAVIAELAKAGRWDDEPDVTHHRKRADALLELAHRANGAGRPSPIHVDTVVVIPADQVAGLDESLTSRCELLGAGPVSTTTALRLALHGTITALVVDGHRVPLDLHRDTRIASHWQRLALAVAADGTCAIEGCTNRRTHAHHVRQWENGGGTDLANLHPTCPGHHLRTIHAAGFTLNPTGDGRWTLHRPDTTPVTTSTWNHRHPPPDD